MGSSHLELLMFVLAIAIVCYAQWQISSLQQILRIRFSTCYSQVVAITIDSQIHIRTFYFRLFSKWHLRWQARLVHSQFWMGDGIGLSRLNFKSSRSFRWTLLMSTGHCPSLLLGHSYCPPVLPIASVRCYCASLVMIHYKILFSKQPLGTAWRHPSSNSLKAEIDAIPILNMLLWFRVNFLETLQWTS